MGNVALAVTSALAAQGARWGAGGGWEGPSGRNELYDGEERVGQCGGPRNFWALQWWHLEAVADADPKAEV